MALLYLKSGGFFRYNESRWYANDKTFFRNITRFLVGKGKEDTEAAVLEGIRWGWRETHLIVYPVYNFEETRISRVWTLDVENDVLIRTTRRGSCLAPLSVARKRVLQMDDFKQYVMPRAPSTAEQTFPGPYWEPQLSVPPREKALLGRMIPDLGRAWHHVLRSPLNRRVFLQLANAVVRLANADFDVVEMPRGKYATYSIECYNLPEWRAPDTAIWPAGKGWFVLAQDAWEGLTMIREHIEDQRHQFGSTAGTKAVIYAIITLRHIILCEADGGELRWTRPEVLFHSRRPPSGRAINMLLWTAETEPTPNHLDKLPLEIQDQVLLYLLSPGTLAPAQMGCKFGWGTAYGWRDGAAELELKETLKGPTPGGQIESHVCFGRKWGGLTYRPKISSTPGSKDSTRMGTL